MDRDFRNLLTHAHEVKLVIDGVTVALTVGSRFLSNPSAEIESTEANMFRLERGIWKIRFNGVAVERRKWIGRAHTHELLKQPYVWIPSAALWIQAKGEVVGSKSENEFASEGYKEAGLFVQSDHGEPVLTEEARRRVLESLQELKEELESLRATGNNDLAFEKEQEIETIKEYLNKCSFRGHQKRFSDPSEKARKRVTAAIDRAIADLDPDLPALARHLDYAIHRGKECRYAPEPEVKWIL